MEFTYVLFYFYKMLMYRPWAGNWKVFEFETSHVQSIPAMVTWPPTHTRQTEIYQTLVLKPCMSFSNSAGRSLESGLRLSRSHPVHKLKLSRSHVGVRKGLIQGAARIMQFIVRYIDIWRACTRTFNIPLSIPSWAKWTKARYCRLRHVCRSVRCENASMTTRVI